MLDPFAVVIEDDEDEGGAPFASPEEAVAAYLESLLGVPGQRSIGKRYAEGVEWVLRRFLVYVNGRPLESLTRGQLERFLQATEARCRHYNVRPASQKGSSRLRVPQCKLDLPLECASCPAREAIAKKTVATTVSTLTGFYKFLVSRGAVEYNLWRDVADAWWSRTRKVRSKEVAMRRYKKRHLTIREVRQFIEGSPHILWAFAMYMQRRYGYRPSELLRLSTSAEYLDPELTWVRVPQSRDDTDKRVNSDPYPIDNEARRFFRAYLAWRRKRLERSGVDSDLLLINEHGRPFPQDKEQGTSALIRGPKRTAARVGLENPESVTNYTGRRGFTNTAEDNGVVYHDLALIRGGAPEFDGAGNYVDPKRLERAFLKGSPPLGVRLPSLPRLPG